MEMASPLGRWGLDNTIVTGGLALYHPKSKTPLFNKVMENADADEDRGGWWNQSQSSTETIVINRPSRQEFALMV